MREISNLNQRLSKVNSMVYDKLQVGISNLRNELESRAYDACRFELNGIKIISRSSKITPNKIGQFATFWKRNQDGETTPYSQEDDFDFYVVNVESDVLLGQFVFPKSVLMDRGYVTSERGYGKRGFRVYPAWDIASNKQAMKTQQWQLEYFYEITEATDLDKIIDLYSVNS